MNVIAWLVLGLIVGLLANLLDPRPAKGGVLGAIALGIAGALVGGYLGNVIFGAGVTGFNIPSFIVAIIGAMLILYVGRALTRRL